MKETKKFSQKFHYIKMLLPAVLVAVLVLQAICLYEAPEIRTGGDVYAQSSGAEPDIPVLKLKKQKAKEKKEPAGSSAPLPEAAEDAEYRDGVFTGRGQGFGGEIVVRVTIKNGKIADVSVVSAPGEDQPYFERARAVIRAMLKKQSTNVDTVSGATYSSNGIISAVRDALSKAVVDKKKTPGSHKDPVKPETDKKRNEKRKPAKKPGSVTFGDWEDGTYTGCGNGFNGKIHIRLTIKGGKITKIVISENSDDKPYINNAKKEIIPAVIAKQGTGVDTVSGATYSSFGILEAINDALKKAVKKKPPNDDTDNDDNTGDDPDDNNDNDDTGDPPDTQEIKISKTLMVYCDEDEDFSDYQLEASFIIRNGAVTDITDVAQTEAEPSNDPYIRAAVKGILRQINAGATMQGIDTVSGATCTAVSLIAGGQDALREYAASQDGKN